MPHETITEAYMRNLREAVYGDTTYTNLPSFPPGQVGPGGQGYFDVAEGEVRFGLNRTEGYAVIAHSLVAERPETTEEGIPSGILYLSWQTFVMNRPLSLAEEDQLPRTTVRPITGTEVVARIGELRVEPVFCAGY